MKKILLAMALIASSNSYAVSQNGISAHSDPKAFNASTCVKASYYVGDSKFKKYGKGSKWRRHMFDVLGKGRYAPNGQYVKANFNTYVATMGKKEASLYLWDAFHCDNLI